MSTGIQVETEVANKIQNNYINEQYHGCELHSVHRIRHSFGLAHIVLNVCKLLQNEIEDRLNYHFIGS